MSISETSKAKQELLNALYRVAGLVDAIYAVSATNANAEIAEAALSGVCKSLEREVDALLEAAASGKIVAVELNETPT